MTSFHHHLHALVLLVLLGLLLWAGKIESSQLCYILNEYERALLTEEANLLKVKLEVLGGKVLLSPLLVHH